MNFVIKILINWFFYSNFNMEDITDIDYRHAKNYINNLIQKA